VLSVVNENDANFAELCHEAARAGIGGATTRRANDRRSKETTT
jgi:hypothetical protein